MDVTSELGVGVVWFGGLSPLVDKADDLIDFFEIEPATTTLPSSYDQPSGDQPAGLGPEGAGDRPTVVHGVSCPLGGTIAPSADELANLAAAADAVNSPWVSEHLSIDRLRQPDGTVAATGFFLPPAQIPETVELAADRLTDLAEITGRPVAFETGVNYFKPQPGHMTDGEFFAAVAERADCFILLDLHNLWCNEHNGRQSVREVIDHLPLGRVIEVHLAGGQDRDGFMLDAHSDLVSPELTDLAAEIIARLPALRALTFELVPDYIRRSGIDAGSYRRQLEDLHRLWNLRGQSLGDGAVGPMAGAIGPATLSEDPGRPESWERALVAALADRDGPLTADPGTGLYRHLIEAIRSGAVVTAMPLTYRYLVSTLGFGGAEAALLQYQQQVPPSAWAFDEAIGFADHVERALPIPHLDEVAGFELAAYRAKLTGSAQLTTFTCEPNRLLEALRSGTPPSGDLGGGRFEVTVAP